MIATDKKRQSVVSNATDVSSNHDELIRAYESYKRNPAPIEEREITGTPIIAQVEATPVEESESEDNSGTDPGILRFTQTPPTVNEQRESTCIMPAYSQGNPFEFYWCLIILDVVRSIPSILKNSNSR